MNVNEKPTFDQGELAASLAPLGIREITERMEVSPLLIDQGDLTQEETISVCCACKFPRDVLDDEGMVSMSEVEPPMGAGMGPGGYR